MLPSIWIFWSLLVSLSLCSALQCSVFVLSFLVWWIPPPKRRYTFMIRNDQEAAAAATPHRARCSGWRRVEDREWTVIIYLFRWLSVGEMDEIDDGGWCGVGQFGQWCSPLSLLFMGNGGGYTAQNTDSWGNSRKTGHQTPDNSQVHQGHSFWLKSMSECQFFFPKKKEKD